ncbi:MAG: site-specific integrase [Janthinobacterium lividum]
MQTAKFVLREPKAATATLIQLFFNFDKQRLKVSTKISIRAAEWNADKQRAITTGKHVLNADLNAQLAQHKAAVENAYSYLKRNQEHVTPEELRTAYQTELEVLRGGKRPTTKQPTLADFATKLIEELAGSRAASTLQVYKSTTQHLRDFEKHSRRSYTFDKINIDFYLVFTAYLENVKAHSPNTVGKVIKTIKSLMTEALERKLHTNLDYKSKKFSVTKEETDAIYLTVPELTTLANLELEAGTPLAHVRDLFVLGAFTGLRFSDLSQLSKNAISGVAGRKTIKVRTQKTGAVVALPVHPIVEAILARNEGHPPKAYSNAGTNRILKQLAKLAGFTDKVEVTTATGKQVRAKYELVTMHTSRRSLATNAYLAGIPTPSIMALTGHSKVQTFLSYIRITAQENADKLAGHAFFNP